LFDHCVRRWRGGRILVSFVHVFPFSFEVLVGSVALCATAFGEHSFRQIDEWVVARRFQLFTIDAAIHQQACERLDQFQVTVAGRPIAQTGLVHKKALEVIAGAGQKTTWDDKHGLGGVPDFPAAYVTERD
jgi:hypothetical protein